MAYFIIGGDGKTYGPKPDREIREWIREGRLNATSNIATEGSEDWRPLSEFPEFVADLNPAAAPVGAVQPQQPVQPQTQPYPQYAAAAPAGNTSCHASCLTLPPSKPPSSRQRGAIAAASASASASSVAAAAAAGRGSGVAQ